MTLKRRQGRGLPVADALDEGGQHIGLREVIETARWLRGDFPLIRNDLSLTKALSAYNQPFHSEHRLTGLNGAGLLALPYRR
jgi:hypothetical protein